MSLCEAVREGRGREGGGENDEGEKWMRRRWKVYEKEEKEILTHLS